MNALYACDEVKTFGPPTADDNCDTLPDYVIERDGRYYNSAGDELYTAMDLDEPFDVTEQTRLSELTDNIFVPDDHTFYTYTDPVYEPALHHDPEYQAIRDDIADMWKAGLVDLKMPDVPMSE